MATTAVPVGFDYVFGLAQKLPPEERKQLARKLETVETEPEELEKPPKITRFDGFILVEYPYASAEDEVRCRKNREALEAEAAKIPPEKREEMRRRSREVSMTAPAPTDEECAIWDEMERRKAEACRSI